MFSIICSTEDFNHRFWCSYTVVINFICNLICFDCGLKFKKENINFLYPKITNPQKRIKIFYLCTDRVLFK